MDIEQLIVEAKSLKEITYDSPRIDLWQQKVEKLLKNNYGEDYADLFSSLFNQGVLVLDIYDDRAPIRRHREQMDKVIDLLGAIKDENDTEENQYSPSLSSLNKEIRQKCSSLYDKGEYPEAVEKGFKTVRDRLRDLTNFEKGSEAFGKGKLHITGASALNVDKDFNEGVKFLTMAIDRFRNEKSHTSDARIDDPRRAYEYLSLSSLAMNLLDNAEIVE